MRTKSFLAAAALIAVGALSAQAQSNVYSLNVVGYVNLTLSPGYNLVTVQLKDAANPTAPVNAVLTNITDLADGSLLFTWNPTTQDYNQAANWVGPTSGGPAWYNGDFSELVTDAVPLGSSFFIKNEGASTATVTLVGEVPQGALSAAVGNNYGFYGDLVPVAQEIATNGFPVVDSSLLFSWNKVAQDYNQALNGVGAGSGGPAWYNGDFSEEIKYVPQVGEGFLYQTPSGAATWNRNFTVQ